MHSQYIIICYCKYSHRSLKQDTRVPPRSDPTDSENDSSDDDDDDDKEVPPQSDKDKKTNYCLAL